MPPGLGGGCFQNQGWWVGVFDLLLPCPQWAGPGHGCRSGFLRGREQSRSWSLSEAGKPYQEQPGKSKILLGLKPEKLSLCLGFNKRFRFLVSHANNNNNNDLQFLCEHGLPTWSWNGQRALVDKRFDVKLVGSRLWRTWSHPLEIAWGLQDSNVTLDRKRWNLIEKLFYHTWTRSPRMSCAWWCGRGTGWAGTLWCPPFGPPPCPAPWPTPWPTPWPPPAPSPLLWWLPTLRFGETLPPILLPLFPSVRSIVASPPSTETPGNILSYLPMMRTTMVSQFQPIDRLNGNPWGLFTSLSEILSEWSSAERFSSRDVKINGDGDDFVIMVMMLVAMMVMFIFYGGHGEILIERKRDVKIDGGGRRLERSIEEQSLQIWWREWQSERGMMFKFCNEFKF